MKAIVLLAILVAAGCSNPPGTTKPDGDPPPTDPRIEARIAELERLAKVQDKINEKTGELLELHYQAIVNSRK